jgi:hypothetical protein
MTRVHEFLAYAVVGLFTIGWVWGLGARLLRRGPGDKFWWWLAATQVTLGAEVLLGMLLFAEGHRVETESFSVLHYIYGGLPIVLLVFAHAIAREGNAAMVGLNPSKRIAPWVPFAWASFICFGLTLRALTTGLGIG